MADDDPTPDVGTEVARRYRLDAFVAEGGGGSVWKGHDLRRPEVVVAVKLVEHVAPEQAARARREAAILRLMRVPGVVELLDDGAHGAYTFIVMPWVEGRPFPGRATPCAWDELRATTLALLETLAAIHRAMVVHRDLKPANVLVDARGVPVVLDFGVARRDGRADSALTGAEAELYTARYAAPEQLRWAHDQVSPRTDLYAVGLMLHAALVGELPYAGRAPIERASRPAPPIQESRPDLPPNVARAIDRMLAVAPEERPATAEEVLALLGGGADPARPFTVQRTADALVRAIDALEAGRSVALVGPAGHGRSWGLDRVCDALERRGLRAVRAVPARAPLASLARHAAPPGDLDACGLDALVRWFCEGFDGVVPPGALLAVDDLERVDGVTRRCALAAARLGRVLVTAAAAPDAPGFEVVTLEPWAPAELAELFEGPDRLLHLREDAAAALHARTGGIASRVFAELGAWERAGLARRDGARLRLSRDALELLDAGLLARPPASAAAREAPGDLDAPFDEVLSWVAVAAQDATHERLAAAMGRTLWWVEAAVGELARRGLVTCGEEGVRLAVRWEVDAHVPRARRRAMHLRLAAALEPAAPRRLLHLLSADGPEAPIAAAHIAEEALAQAARLDGAGRSLRAAATLDDALRWLRARPHTASEREALLARWAVVALRARAPLGLDRVLYEIDRSEAPTPELLRVRRLLALAQREPRRDAGLLAELDALGAFADPGAEHQRQQLRCAAAWRTSTEALIALLEESEASATAPTDVETRARRLDWLGRLRYRQGRFEEAARLHAQCAAQRVDPVSRLWALLNAASALMEAFRLDEARERGARALDEARRLRHPVLEAKAEWVARAVDYRAGVATAVDLALADAAAHVPPDLEAMICVNEAAVAWRLGDRPLAQRLAGRAAARWAALDEPLGALVAGPLLAASGGVTSPEEVARWVAEARACDVPGVGVQALALLAIAGRAAPPERAVCDGLCALVRESFWDRRMDVLSVRECVEALAAPRVG